jgi:hypothetical protein
VVWFWDDNMLVKRKWAKDLLSELAGLDKWWLTQASIDIVKDRELLDLMERSGCIGIFLGIESLDDATSRASASDRTRPSNTRMPSRACMTGASVSWRASFPASTTRTPTPSWPHQTVSTPSASMCRFSASSRRFVAPRSMISISPAGAFSPTAIGRHYNGYNVAFQPAQMSPHELLSAQRALWKRAFGPKAVLERLAGAAGRLNSGGMMLAAAMNGFYGMKRLTGNGPIELTVCGEGRIVHAVSQGANSHATR